MEFYEGIPGGRPGDGKRSTVENSTTFSVEYNRRTNPTGMGGERSFDSCRGFPGEGPVGIDERRRSSSYPDGALRKDEPKHPRVSTFSISTGRSFRFVRRSIGDDKDSPGGVRLQLGKQTTSVLSTGFSSSEIGRRVGRDGRGGEIGDGVWSNRARPTTRLRQGSTNISSSMGENPIASRTVAQGDTDNIAAEWGRASVRPPPPPHDAHSEASGETLPRRRIARIHRTESGWGISTGDRLPSAQQVPAQDTVQDGRCSVSGGDHHARRLRHVGGSKGCLPHDGVASKSPQILPIHRSSRSKNAMEDGELWRGGSSTHLHKVIKTVDWGPQELGDTYPNIYRRRSYCRSRSDETVSGDGIGHGPPAGSGGSSIKGVKVLFPPSSNVQMSWLDMEHKGHESLGSTQAIEGDAEDSISPITQYRRSQRHSTNPYKRLSAIGGEDYCHDPSDQRSSPSFVVSSTGLGARGKKRRVERLSAAFTGGVASAQMVDDRGTMEAKRITHCERGPGDPSQGQIGCRNGDVGMGRHSTTGQRPRVHSEGLLHGVGAEAPHQRPGTSGLLVHNPCPPWQSGAEEKLAPSTPIVSTGLDGGHQVLSGGGQQVTHPIPTGRTDVRLDGSPSSTSVLQAPRRHPERGGGSPVARGMVPHRMETAPTAFRRGGPSTSTAGGVRFIRKSAKPTGAKVFFMVPRFRVHGMRLSEPPVVHDINTLRVPAADTSRAGPSEGASGGGTRLTFGGASVDDTNMVADAPTPTGRCSPVTPQPRMDSGGSGGGTSVAMPVESLRLSFIRKHAKANGISRETLEGMWASNKTGYPKAYDPHFERFQKFFQEQKRTSQHDGRFSPRSIHPDTLVAFLRDMRDAGASLSSIKDASSSVSMACFEATDGEVHLGKRHSVTRYLKSQRLVEPVGQRKLSVPIYADVARLLQDAWLFGPDEALGLRHLQEKCIIILIVDTAARPSDLARLYRSMEGRHAQIRYKGDDVELRYFWSKEVVPGSTRRNSTNVFFSKWVTVRDTTPSCISAPRCLRSLLQRSTDPSVYAEVRLDQIGVSRQPLFWGQKRHGKMQPSSVDTISNTAQRAIDRVGMGKMKTAHLRGASTSKITQLVPECRTDALALGRWTDEATFRNHYECEVQGSWKPVPQTARGNCQQILRHGFRPRPPKGVSVKEYTARPQSWVGKRIRGVGLVKQFEDGVYTVGSQDFLHWDFMAALARGRAKQPTVR